ncbi:lysylphosphatidylglycerol synthase transmembrane domain-containing protein [Verrucomicrobium sp. 3C]|uniref:lysylphosphatidylglycerol synthase transmembrane domain-containing protein n=1 Tax=Verrucomicrobium sp. 3C TaxID=1134055 RepID=UPI0003A5F49D|nr:lysylphosphatidylglycerol synthase transmembrane domain-containing protein [Verrucomicrobium sp. 3C]
MRARDPDREEEASRSRSGNGQEVLILERYSFMDKFRGFGWVLLRSSVSVLLLTLIIRRVPWAAIDETLREADPVWLLGAILLAGVQVAFASLRWQALLRAQEIPLSLGETMRLTLIGRFFNAFLPGSTGGDLVRIYYAVRLAPKQKAAASLSVLYDRFVGVVILLLIGSGLCFFLYPILAKGSLVQDILLVFLLVALGIFLVALLAWLLPSLLRRRPFRLMERHAPFHRLLEELSHATRRFAADRNATVRAALFSLGAHSSTFGFAWFAATALRLPIPFFILATILAVVSVFDAIPISISGLGVREGLLVLFFQPLGFTSTQAVTFSLLFFGTTLFWSFAGGIVYWRQKAKRSAEAAP